MKRARDVWDQLEGLLERVEIDVMSNSDNVAIRKVKEGGTGGGGGGGEGGTGREGQGRGREGEGGEGGRGGESKGGEGREGSSHFYNFCRQSQQGFSTTLPDSRREESTSL